jgi:hypothetical protein
VEIKLLKETDRDIYTELASQHGCVFNRLDWLALAGKELKVYGIYNNENKLIGGFYIYYGTQFGFRHLKSPPYSPYIGLFFQNKTHNAANSLSFEKSIHQLINEFLKTLSYGILTLQFPPEYKDMQVYTWNKYKVSPMYTYYYDLSYSEEELSACMSPERRNDIKKAAKDAIETRICKDYKEVKMLVMKTFDRKKKDLSEEMLDKILFSYANESNSFAHVSYRDSRPIAASFCLVDSKKAYYLLGGYDNEHKHQGAGASAVWMAVKHAKALGLKYFDFEGSMIIPVEKYFRGFGAQLVPYYSINKAFLPFEFLLKFIKREVF